jgi:hypothetical protein
MFKRSNVQTVQTQVGGYEMRDLWAKREIGHVTAAGGGGGGGVKLAVAGGGGARLVTLTAAAAVEAA